MHSTSEDSHDMGVSIHAKINCESNFENATLRWSLLSCVDGSLYLLKLDALIRLDTIIFLRAAKYDQKKHAV